MEVLHEPTRALLKAAGVDVDHATSARASTAASSNKPLPGPGVVPLARAQSGPQRDLGGTAW